MRQTHRIFFILGKHDRTCPTNLANHLTRHRQPPRSVKFSSSTTTFSRLCQSSIDRRLTPNRLEAAGHIRFAMASRPTVTILGADGKATQATHTMPAVFTAPIRPDIVQDVHKGMAKNKRQPYSVSEKAGHQTSAESWGTGQYQFLAVSYASWDASWIWEMSAILFFRRAWNQPTKGQKDKM